MFDQLPKLFDKNFATAYFLPSAGFILATYFIFSKFKLVDLIFDFSKESLLQDVTLIGLAALILAVILSVFNRKLIRFLEGYWKFSIFGFHINLIPYFNKLEVLRYENLDVRKEKLKTNANLYDERTRKNIINRIEKQRAYEFPSQKHLILPTSFGNIYRAFENYAKVMYGIDAIVGWFRLSAVIPSEFSTQMNDARARVDFGVNLWFLSLLLILEYIFVGIYIIRVPDIQSFFSRETLWWFPLSMLILSYLSYSFAKNAVAIWGNWVKTAFDLYLPELRKKLEFPTPETVEEEKEMWKNFNLAVHYRKANRLPKKQTKKSEEESKPNNLIKSLDGRVVDRLLILNITLKLLQQELELAIESIPKNIWPETKPVNSEDPPK